MASQSAAQTAHLDIRNHTDQTVTIEADGRTVVRIAPGSSARVEGLPAGQRTLRALAGDEVLESVTAALPPQGTFVWNLGEADYLRSGAPLLRVRNYAGQPIRLLVQGFHRIDIGPAEAATLTGVPLGEVELEARDMDDRTLARTRVEMVAGLERVWTVEGAAGATALIVIHNQTHGPLRVTVDEERTLELEPNATAQVDALRPGLHVIRAHDRATGRLMQTLEAELRPNTAYEWMIEQVTPDPATSG